MAETPRLPRTSDTKDLSASLRSNGRRWVDGRVLNLSKGGMLVASGSDLDVGDCPGFELSGFDFSYGGRSEVAHRTGGAIGLHFLSWEGLADRAVSALVDARLRAEQWGARDADALSGGCAPVWDSREFDRAHVAALFAVIEDTRAGTRSRHHVIDVSEHGMRIVGLALPVGARVSFTLEGAGIDYLGHGHVAHRSSAFAGIAVDHWDGAPEAIRSLVRGAAEPVAQSDGAYVADWSVGPP